MLHPAARVLILTDAPAPEGGPTRNIAARPLPRIGEIARECGCVVEEAPTYSTIGTEAPELVIFDGTAILSPPSANGNANGNGRAARALATPNLDVVRELRTMFVLDTVTFVAVISERLSADDLTVLQEAGAGAFLSADASPLEVASRLQSAVDLCRTRNEIADLRAQITRSLRIDETTGVMTRRFFFQSAHRECARARRYGHPLSCLMVEVDHYRRLCARFSDPTGENVLRSVAAIIGQWTRDSDIIARFGDAKFVVLLPETDIDGATGAREKLLKALSEHPWRKDDAEIPVSVSVGEAQLEQATHFRFDIENSSESDDMGETALSTREAMAGLLEDADAALSIARKGARMPEIFVPQMLLENKSVLLSRTD